MPGVEADTSPSSNAHAQARAPHDGIPRAAIAFVTLQSSADAHGRLSNPVSATCEDDIIVCYPGGQIIQIVRKNSRALSICGDSP